MVKRAKLAEARIIGILRGRRTANVYRRRGVSKATLKFGGMPVSGSKRLKALEVESARLEKMRADVMPRDLKSNK